MKKIIPIFFVLLLLMGCKTEKYTPVIKAELELSAVYKTGDFSYSCKIIKNGDFISVTPTSTRAKGMVISCNGKEVSFKRKDFVKTFPLEKIPETNPAVILYRVFSLLDTAQVHLIDEKFTYTGNCKLGKFVLTQNKDNSIEKISVPKADIEICFS